MNRQEKILTCLKANPDWGRLKISKATGIPPATVQRHLLKLGSERSPKSEFQQEQTETSNVLVSRSPNIKTVDDLLAYAEVDLSIWEVDRFVVNKWDIGAKTDDGEIITRPLHQVKVWLKRKGNISRARDAIADILEEFRTAGPISRTAPKISTAGNLLEVSVFDLHFGKLCWGQETGTDWDSSIAESSYVQAVNSLIRRASGEKISRILLPVGNDFFNVDNTVGTTTAGTRQDEDGRWQRSFVLGRKMMVEAINRLREVAPVSVVMVAGNHDYERVFYLGDVLEAWFHRCKDVQVDNRPTPRKYFAFGKCLVGLTHGNNEKHSDLPLLMATEEPKAWAASEFREFHLGHWHTKREIHFQPVFEKNGIRVRIIPSLCPPDAWHKIHGYSGLRAAEAYLWNSSEGCVATLSHFPG